MNGKLFLLRTVALAGSALFSAVLWTFEALLRWAPKFSRGVGTKLQRRAEAAPVFQRALREKGLQRPLWCHVASAGELEEAIPVLERWRAVHPHGAIVVTCFSASGLAAAAREERKRKAPWDLVGPLPADLPFVAAGFVRALNPVAALFVHRELWPWHLRALERRDVPSALVQVRTQSADHLDRGWRVVAPWLERFSLVGTVDGDAARAVRLLLPGAKPRIEALGDARIDRIVARLEGLRSGGASSLVLASVWPEDIAALTPAFPHPAVRARALIVVPHEPHATFVADIERRLLEAGWRVRTAPSPMPVEIGEAEIVTTVGGLAERYPDAAIAFIGGSFRARVHNVLEPAVAGCALLTGPRTANAPDAAALDREGALRHVIDAAAFVAACAEWSDPNRLRTARDAAKRYVDGRRGAGERTVRALAEAWPRITL